MLENAYAQTAEEVGHLGSSGGPARPRPASHDIVAHQWHHCSIPVHLAAAATAAAAANAAAAASWLLSYFPSPPQPPAVVSSARSTQVLAHYGTDPQRGLTASQVAEARRLHGRNELAPEPGGWRVNVNGGHSAACFVTHS